MQRAIPSHARSCKLIIAFLGISVLMAAASLGASQGFLTGPAADDPLDIAQRYLRDHGTSLRLAAEDLADMALTDRYVTKHNGVTHIYLVQRLQGIEVFNGLVNVNVARDGSVINLGNRFVSNLARSINARSPQVTAGYAVERAAQHLGLKTAPQTLEVETSVGGPAHEVVFKGSGLSMDAIPARLMYLPVESGKARLVWDLRIRPNDQHAWQMEVDALTGVVLKKLDLVQRDSYKIYAWPAESPNHVAGPLPLPPADGRVVVSETAADANASPFGWHDLNGVMGAETVNTTGNNVLAQTDLDANDVFTPATDIQPLSATRDFVFGLDLTQEPSAYREGVVTNLFYWNNIIHDLHYLYGFDEAAGNFQNNNYGNGGIGQDAVQADAQDGSGTDNANFLTLPDGAPPRMQMFVWTAPPAVRINAPPSIAGDYASAPAAFGAPITATGVTGDVELVDDGTPSGSQGCGSLQGFTPGNIALIDRGTCEFGLKVLNAQNAGASAAIIANNQGDGLVAMGAGASGASVTISSAFIGQTDGSTIKTALLTDTVNATLIKVLANRDSDLDNGVIIHEYTHGVSNRLTGGPQMITCLSNDQQGGEGWSDWFALAFTARAGAAAADPRGIGTYLIFQDPPNFGSGIRPYPYSTDLSINPQTYGDLTTGVLTVPHGVGSVWATTLWEMYWAIVDGVPSLGLPGAGYRQNLYDLTEPLAGNQIALQLVMDGMKLQPCNPSFLDARDAILAADLANNDGAFQCHIWYAFAKRGQGVNALDDGGALNVTEDFLIPGSCSQQCITPPTFAGANQILTATDGTCGLTINWMPAVNNCGSEPVTYDLYRSTSPGFLPAPGNRLASNLTVTSYNDVEVQSGTEYFYLVRATDGLGNTDSNLARRSEIPVGTLTPGGAFLDDAGDTSTVKFARGATVGNTWAIRPSGGVSNTRVHATTASGNYADNSCMTIETDTVFLGAAPTLSFQSKFDIEPGWDGAIVEISTAGGGFANWTKLETITYPGVMAGPAGDPSCNNPGLADGQPVFTGTSGGQYVPFSGSLSAFANQPVRLRFVFTSDGATNDLGWFLDNISIDSVQEAGPCVSIGTCTLDPFFAGISSLAPSLAATCGTDLAWAPATARCPGSSVRYNIYRSQNPAFFPSTANAIRLGESGLTYHDAENLADGTPYYYVVRAEDTTTSSSGPANGGNEDNNQVRRSARPRGALIGPAPNFFDDMEPSANPGYGFETPVNVEGPASPTWAVTADPTSHSLTNSFFSRGSLDVKDDRLIAPLMNLTPASRLTFWHKFGLENTYDGGVLEVSTDEGFTWSDVLAGGGSFLEGGYNSEIVSDAGSLIAGRPAWTGINDSFENMDRVTVDLGAFAGTDVLMRWRLVTDPFVPGATPVFGWWVDDVGVTNLNSYGVCSTLSAVASGVVLDTLTVGREPDGDLTLSWGASCVTTDDDYAIYEGSLDDFYSHEPKVCSTEGETTMTFAPATGSRYYLVVPRNELREGSYGRRSNGAERPQGASNCRTQQIAPPCL